MELQAAMDLVKNAVKYTGVIDQKHIDLTIVPSEERPKYEEALKVCQLSIKEGKITREEFLRKINIDP